MENLILNHLKNDRAFWIQVDDKKKAEEIATKFVKTLETDEFYFFIKNLEVYKKDTSKYKCTYGCRFKETPQYLKEKAAEKEKENNVYVVSKIEKKEGKDDYFCMYKGTYKELIEIDYKISEIHSYYIKELSLFQQINKKVFIYYEHDDWETEYSVDYIIMRIF